MFIKLSNFLFLKFNVFRSSLIGSGNSELHFLFATFQVLYYFQYYPSTVLYFVFKWSHYKRKLNFYHLVVLVDNVKQQIISETYFERAGYGELNTIKGRTASFTSVIPYFSFLLLTQRV